MFGVTILNPFKLDWQQRLSLLVAISAFAYFLAHTLHKPKAETVESEQRIGFLERQVESLQSQQKQLADLQTNATKEKERRQAIRGQLALFLKEGKAIQDGIEYNNPASLAEKKPWENRVEEYLIKSLDESYATRFRSPSHQVLSSPIGISQPMRGAWADVGAKMAMLNDFMSELRQ